MVEFSRWKRLRRGLFDNKGDEKYFKVYRNPGSRFVITYENPVIDVIWVKCSLDERSSFSTICDDGIHVIAREYTITREEVVQEWEKLERGEDLRITGNWYAGTPWVWHHHHTLNHGAALAIELTNICKFETDCESLESADWPEFFFKRLEKIETLPFTSVSRERNWDDLLDYWFVKTILAIGDLAQRFKNQGAEALKECFYMYWDNNVETIKEAHGEPAYSAVWSALLIAPLHLCPVNDAVLWEGMVKNWNRDSGVWLRQACDGLRTHAYFDLEAERRIVLKDSCFQKRKLRWKGIIDILKRFEEWEHLGYCVAIGREAGYEV